MITFKYLNLMYYSEKTCCNGKTIFKFGIKVAPASPPPLPLSNVNNHRSTTVK